MYAFYYFLNDDNVHFVKMWLKKKCYNAIPAVYSCKSQYNTGHNPITVPWPNIENT